MPLELDFTQYLVNVHWGGGAFLYSGADGMFGSSDGQTWEKAPKSEPEPEIPSSVLATSLAWIDDVWIASGPDGCWRSIDGAQTWPAMEVPAFKQVAAMKPTGIGQDGKPKPSVFAGWFEDDDGDNHIVYTSHDLGKTWHEALRIPTNGGSDDGFEGIQGLSGCGGGLFVCTIWHSSPYHHGDGKIYSSTDGHEFSAQTVFGPGNETLPGDPDQFPRKGFTAAAVGYDATTNTYIAVGEKGIIPAFGINETYLIYTISTSHSFSKSEGTVAESGSLTPGGKQVGAVPSAAGGDGKHVTGSLLFEFAGSGAFIREERRARFIPGDFEVLVTGTTLNRSYIGSFCYSQDAEAATDAGGTGVFACTAFAANMAGGVFIAASSGETAGESFSQTHAGTGIDVDGRPAGAVAVGNLSWLGSTSSGE